MSGSVVGACDTVWTGARLLPLTDVAQPLAVIENAVIAAQDGRVVYAGAADTAPAFTASTTIDCAGRSKRYHMPQRLSRTFIFPSKALPAS